MGLQEIVNVSISRETKPVTQQGFGTILILGPNANFATRTQEFFDVDATLSAVLAGGSAAAEYKAALAALSQNPRVVSIKIGAIQGTKTLTDDAGTYTAGAIAATINGTEYSVAYNTDKDTTMGDLATAIATDDAVLSAVYSSVAHTILITPNTGYVLGVSVDISAISGTMAAVAITATATEDVDDALDAIIVEDDDFYGLCAVTRDDTEQELIAAWTESKKKVFCLASADADIVDTTDAADTTTIAAILKAGAYARSFGVYSSLAATEYPDAALLGKILPFDPGTYTAKFKTLAGVTRDVLTASQSTNARAKNFNTNEEIGGSNIIREGTVCEGEFIDTIIFIDWLAARMTEEVYGVLKRSKKVPYTTSGMNSIRAAMDKPLKIGQNRGGISEYAEDDNGIQIGGYVITLPAFASISANDKAARRLTDVKFTAWLAGAIHSVSINGIVTV